MSKDRIKNRMLKKASRAWGYNELESEHSFDPVLELLLSACASELEKLGFEQENSRNRISERILEVLFPDEITGAIPAQTLLYLHPLENNIKVSLYDSFKVTKHKQNVYDPSQTISKDLYFSPTLDMTLTTAQIKYVAYGQHLIEKENYFFEDVLGKSTKELPSGSYWVGIYCPNIEKLEDLTFYIDINNEYQKEIFFHYLKQVKVMNKKGAYPLQEGYDDYINSVNYESIITKNYTNVRSVYNEINTYYWDYFFKLKTTIHKEDSLGDELIRNYFPELDLDVQTDIIWLKFEFYEVIGSEILENIKIALNCIPAVNMYNTKENKRIKGRLNIFPILGEDHFLDIDYVLDETGKFLDVKDYDTDSKVSVVLRKKGVARFDERNALEQVQQLLGVLKDETAAFSVLGNDIINLQLKQIAQNLATIYQIITEKNLILNENPFLVISSNEKELDMGCTVSYWHTSGEAGNHLKIGTSLEKSKDNKLAIKNAVMIKPSFGGRDNISSQDRILEYRNALLTRGRIVTVADIKAFGRNHFKEAIVALEVQKGTKKNISLKGGFQRTLDIYLHRNTSVASSMNDTEWEYLKESFLIKLEKASANVYPYRLFEK